MSVTTPDLSMPDLSRIDPRTVDAADQTARYWTSKERGPIKPGSEAHKRAMCMMFHETFNPYKPSVLAWPKLDQETQDKITSLPIWDIAVQTEGKARLRMAAYARQLMAIDPDMGKTIELNGWEENRHKEVLSKLVEVYGIPLEPEPPYVEPRDPEWAYMVTGYSECIDSFFAFGLFELAKRSGFFPAELVETFEPVIQEECRHILLFANWVAWHRANLPIHKRIWFELRVAAVYAFLGWERIGIARGIDDGPEGKKTGKPQDNNFTVNGSKAVSSEDIKVFDLMRICLEENDRRFSGYDSRLLRPTTFPALVRLALKFVPQRKAANRAAQAA
ncbi:MULTISPECIES: ferritin-like domain-containing protein [Acidiphilium]|uniref:ferritin-like domain-containing protein n=1 Tax=Acidiphilium TaxID=522 RepID=UPI00258033D3|nr:MULTISPECIES: ferritin-like domain-containing protein [Acidiphilium]HQT83929.1 ferritin-like domain-containing protein [Acidiphilium rubrum]